jgi:hypothetical protein
MKNLNLKNLKIVRYFKQKISNFKYNWGYLGVLSSPFVGLRLKWYFGEIAHGMPYFYPRKNVKCDRDDAVNAWNKMNVNSRMSYSEKENGREIWIKNYIKSYTKFVPIKYFGFASTTLGWKTKWDEYRFEWSPCYSLIIFGKQLFVSVIPKMEKTCEDRSIRMDVLPCSPGCGTRVPSGLQSSCHQLLPSPSSGSSGGLQS